MIEEYVVTAGFEPEATASGAELNALLTVGEVFDDGVAAAALNTEGVVVASAHLKPFVALQAQAPARVALGVSDRQLLARLALPARLQQPAGLGSL